MRQHERGPSDRGPGPASLRERAATLVVVAAVVVVLLQTLRMPLLYDDTSIIRDNPTIRGWGALLRVWSEPYWPTTGPDTLGLYRPLHVALLATVWNLTSGSPLAFHLYALVLACGTAVSVLWLLRRAADLAAALVCAAWFATHPLHVEAIASVSNSSELLVALFTVALARLFMHRAPDGAANNWGHALLAALAAAGALAAKESGLLALPVALLTAWGWRGSDEEHPPVRDLIRANRRALALACAAIACVLLARAMVLGAPVTRVSIAAQGLPEEAVPRLLAMMSLWPRIVEMLVWPARLSPYYGPSVFPADGVALALAGVTLVAALLGLAAREAVRGDRRPLVAVGRIALTYLPASNLLVPTGQILADRTLFGATLGAALALAWLVDRVSARLRRTAVVVAGLLAVVGGVTAMQYSLAWRSHRQLWTHLVHVAPAEHLGYKMLGMDARGRGDHERAVLLLQRAHGMAPADRQVRFELGQALYASGRFARAARMLAPLMRDGDASAEPALVALYLDAVGRSGGAEAVVRAARPLLRSASGATAALYTGLALERLGRAEHAESAYLAGLRGAPQDSALRMRAHALARDRALRVR